MSLSKWIKYKCKISNANHIEMNIHARQGGFPFRAYSGSCCLLPRHFTGTHQGQILLAKPFKGGTAAHMCWMELKWLRDEVLLEIEALAMVIRIHLVVGETLIAQHDWGCQDTWFFWWLHNGLVPPLPPPQSCALTALPLSSFGRERKLPPPSFFLVEIVQYWGLHPTWDNGQASPPWWAICPPLQHGFNKLPQSDAWAAIRRGWPRALRLGFIRIHKITAWLI